MVQAYNLELGTIFKQLIELNGLEKGTEIILSWYKEVKLDFHEESRTTTWFAHYDKLAEQFPMAVIPKLNTLKLTRKLREVNETGNGLKSGIQSFEDVVYFLTHYNELLLVFDKPLADLLMTNSATFKRAVVRFFKNKETNVIGLPIYSVTSSETDEWGDSMGFATQFTLTEKGVVNLTANKLDDFKTFYQKVVDHLVIEEQNHFLGFNHARLGTKVNLEDTIKNYFDFAGGK